MTYNLIKAKAVRGLVKQNGKRCGKLFLQSLDMFVYGKIVRCTKEHNGGCKTLDGMLVNLVK